jgi:hypothetical protein
MDPNTVKKIKNSVQVLTTVLMDILRNPATRSQSIANFQKEVWMVDASGEELLWARRGTRPRGQLFLWR